MKEKEEEEEGRVLLPEKLFVKESEVAGMNVGPAEGGTERLSEKRSDNDGSSLAPSSF